MAFTHSFSGYTPPPRYDDDPWTHVRIEESDAVDGPYEEVETIELDPVDADPENPQEREVTTDEATLDEGWFRLVFVDASDDESPASEPVYSPAPSGDYYSTIADLKAEPGVPDDLSDAETIRHLEDASDYVDELLGVWPVDEDTGRKIVEDEVEAWQWTKLGRVTARLAGRLYGDPTYTTGARYRSVSGPDFSYTDPIGSRFGDDIEALVNQTGLRRLTTTLAGNRGRPPWYSFSFNTDVD